MKTVPPVVSSSAAAPASGGTRSSPAFGGGVPFLSSSSGFAGSSSSTLTAPFDSLKFAALSPLPPHNAAVAATSSGNTQLSPAFCAFTATRTYFAAPALSSFGFGSTNVSLFGSSSTATPFFVSSFPSAASTASLNSSSPYLGTGTGSAVFGSSAMVSFPAPLPLAFGTPAHEPPPGVKQPHHALSSTPSVQHLPVDQASIHQVAAQDFDEAPRSAPQSGQRMKHEDALEYLERIRATFSQMPFIYNSFLAMMQEFKSQKINTQQVIDRTTLLFKGHPDLIDGFNMFLPAGHRIKVDRTEASSPSENPMANQFSASYEPCT
jgi:hypothetical protein